MIFPAVSMGHSFILVTFTSARVCEDGDMVIEEVRGTREEEERMWFSAAARWSSSSVDESEVRSGNVDGDDGAWRVSARVRRGVDRVSSVVGLPESSKRRLELRVRSGVRVEGCRDRMVC